MRIICGLFLGTALAAIACSDSSESGVQPVVVQDAAQDLPSQDGYVDSAIPDAIPEASQEAEAADRYAEFDKVFEAELGEMCAMSAAFAIMEDGKVTHAKGFGSRKVEGTDPVLPTTLFRIGSVTKMMTATGLLRLVDSGQVDLDAPVTKYLPGFHLDDDPAAAPSMLVRHLLTHSTGMSDYIQPLCTSEDDSLLLSFLTGDVFSSHVHQMAPSGRMWNYSNPNFMFAGLLSETVGAQPYREYMKSHVFKPLGMDRTFFLSTDVTADGDYAEGLDFGKVVDTACDNGWARPCGFAWSSVLDLAKFAEFLMTGNEAVISKNAWEQLRAQQINTLNYLDIQQYGFGIMSQSGWQPDDTHFYPQPVLWHSGALPGYGTFIAVIPSTRFAFITLANCMGTMFNKSLLLALTTLQQPPAPQAAPDVSFPPSSYGKYTGTFSAKGGTAAVTTDGVNLYIAKPATSTPVKMDCPTRDNCSFGAGENQYLTFILDSQGSAEYLRNQGWVYKKVGEAPDGGVPGDGGTPPPIPPMRSHGPDLLHQEGLGIL